MRTMERFSIFIAAILLMSMSAPCFAAGSAFKEVFEDSLYGGLTGTLVGAAIMAFTKRPGDHLDYLSVGAAVGVLTGATYGAISTTRSLAEVENGKVKFAIPTVIPDFGEPNSKGQANVTVMAEVLRGRF